MQFYDSPKNVKENPFGNYDFPQNSSVPVYRKPCGCVIKLPSNNNEKPFAPTKVKLTGTGKMPVQDLRHMTLIEAKEDHNNIPVYAVVNKTKPKKEFHNYTNVDPATGVVKLHANYVNLQPVKKVCKNRAGCESPSPPPPPRPPHRDYKEDEEEEDPYLPLPPEDTNYMLMHPANHDPNRPNFAFSDLSELPLIPFQPINDDRCQARYDDTISRKLRELNQGLEGLANAKSKSSDMLDTRKPPQQYVTMPRSASSSGGSGAQNGDKSTEVNMRRSASVPCKRRNRDRGSTGSSDSGFSTGSPPRQQQQQQQSSPKEALP